MNQELELTPLGAAVVEALPDRTKVQKIQRVYQRSKRVPVSVLFPTAESVESFYRGKGETVQGYRL